MAEKAVVRWRRWRVRHTFKFVLLSCSLRIDVVIVNGQPQSGLFQHGFFLLLPFIMFLAYSSRRWHWRRFLKAFFLSRNVMTQVCALGNVSRLSQVEASRPVNRVGLRSKQVEEWKRSCGCNSNSGRCSHRRSLDAYMVPELSSAREMNQAKLL